KHLGDNLSIKPKLYSPNASPFDSLRTLRKLSLAIPLALSGITLGSTNALAQIIPDNSLGNENSVVKPINPNIERIDRGAIRGTNLFHSFQEFSILEGRGAYFANPAGIRAIFSRVTGTNPSYLFGTLGVLGEANLFLINPNGILFGPNAQLDMRGSFVGSTASGFIFPDGQKFSATTPNAPPLLTVNVSAPVGLYFEGEEPGAVVNSGDLAVESGENITLVGGTVVSTGKLSAPGGEVSLLAVPEVMADGGNPLVEVTETGELENLSAISHSQSSLSDSRTLSELVTGAGNIAELTVTDNGEVQLTATDTSIPTDAGTAIASGSIDVSGDTAGKVQVLGEKVGLFAAEINASGTNGGGTVLIGGDYQGSGSILNAERTYISRDSEINVDGILNGDGGRAIAWADGTTGFYGRISARGGSNSGDGGFVEVSGKENLIFRGEVDTTAPQGNFGTLLLDPQDIRIVDGAGADDGKLPIIGFENDPGTVYTISHTALQSQKGEVVLEATNDIIITPGVSLEFDNDIFLSAGSITFTADADMDDVGKFWMDSGETIKTNGRDIRIEGASITTGKIDSTRGLLGASIAAGDISLTSTNGDITTHDVIAENLIGNGGNITFQAGGNITTNEVITDSDLGDGGNITFQADGNITTDRVDSDGVMNGGNIEFNSNSGMITTQGTVSSASDTGNAGNITFNAEGNIITEKASARSRYGNAGNIEFNSNRGAIDTTAGNLISFSEGGNAGDIILTAEGDIFTGNTIAVSIDGNAGNIEFNSNLGNIDTTAGTLISASDEGNAGNITLTAKGDIITGDENSTSIDFNGIASDINLDNIDITPGSLISASNAGNAGDITLATEGNITTADTISASREGNGGNIKFSSNLGSIDTTAGILASASDSADAGEINLIADSDIKTGDIQAFSIDGDSGAIALTSNQGTINTTAGTLTSASDSVGLWTKKT
ncbi:MAG: filamentous hemagglutinin N-terminal domain-containing protein, partial [Symploca sp. SIO3E6]|nr:filamentous hemagglutinin N-terminal domain-containing protein [Caldora sp. SIO3E6]